MAGWDFTVDSDVQDELSTKLNDGADKFDAKIGEMYGQIDSLSAHWVGEDYDAYKTGTEGYKTALQDLSDGIRMFGAHFKAMSPATITLASELTSIIMNATGSGGGAGGSGSQSGSSGSGSQSGSGGSGSQSGSGGSGSQSGSGGSGSQSGSGGSGSQSGSGGSGSQSGSDDQDDSGANNGWHTVEATVLNSENSYSIRRGDDCVINYNGKDIDATYWATDSSSGSNFYKVVDENGYETVLKQKPDGTFEDLHIPAQDCTIKYAEDGMSMIGGFTTDANDAASRNLPTQVEHNGNYDVYDSPYELVHFGDPRGNNLYGSTETTKITTNDELYSSAAAHTPVLEINTRVDVPAFSQGGDLNKNNGTMYLIWDEDSGQYYELENGEFTRGGRGFTPEELSKCKLK